MVRIQNFTYTHEGRLRNLISRIVMKQLGLGEKLHNNCTPGVRKNLHPHLNSYPNSYPILTPFLPRVRIQSKKGVPPPYSSSPAAPRAAGADGEIGDVIVTRKDCGATARSACIGRRVVCLVGDLTLT